MARLVAGTSRNKEDEKADEVVNWGTLFMGEMFLLLWMNRGQWCESFCMCQWSECCRRGTELLTHRRRCCKAARWDVMLWRGR